MRGNSLSHWVCNTANKKVSLDKEEFFPLSRRSLRKGHHISMGCCHRRWWINRPALCKPTSGQFLVIWQSRQAFSSQSEAPSECFCGHFHRSPRDMILHPHLAWMPLKQKPAARGTRAPRLSSIVGSFFLLPSPAFVAGSVVPSTCPLARTAVRASPAGSGEDATSVIIGPPPLQMGHQVWRLLRRGPGPASQGRDTMADGQIDSLNESRIQSSREA
jgi:hypothetical protein